MTVPEFIGCSFLAFGPPFSMFWFTIAKDPVYIIILIAASFFWLLSLLLSAIIWFVLYPLREYVVVGVMCSVFLQEGFRYIIYRLLKQTQEGLQAVTENADSIKRKHVLAYVSGLGFGIISALFALVNVLADASGPATMDLKGGKEIFFLTSASHALFIILLHIFWSIIFFDAADNSNYLYLSYVVGTHLFVSLITLLNGNEMYAVTLPINLCVTIVTALFSFKVAGGTKQSFKRFIICN